MSSNTEFKVFDNSWGESVEEAISKNHIKHYDCKDFNNIQEIQEIGSGSFGKGYRATWKNTHKHIVLKSFKDIPEKEIVREVTHIAYFYDVYCAAH